jgi:hypothetical protein
LELIERVKHEELNKEQDKEAIWSCIRAKGDD